MEGRDDQVDVVAHHFNITGGGAIRGGDGVRVEVGDDFRAGFLGDLGGQLRVGAGFDEDGKAAKIDARPDQDLWPVRAFEVLSAV